MWDNIPKEMQQRSQWAVARKEDKIPRTPTTGELASSTDPNTWGTYDEAVAAAQQRGWVIGYVLSADDPFSIIDLDDKAETPASDEERERHQKIIEAFSSYTERSQSGRGFHIVVKGKIPSGVRRGTVEVYPHSRFMICTGDVVLPFPIAARQSLLDRMYKEMGGLNGSAAHLTGEEEKYSDEQILGWATNADNADKFTRLWAGDFSGYPSQSEADMALMSILRFYSKNVEQVFRLFRQSGLGKRDKAVKNDKYLTATLKRVIQSEPPPVDLTHFNKAPDPPPKKASTRVAYPPGLVGEIAEYIRASATRPVHEIGLAGALAFTAGICARSYNISGVGLNQYLVLLAKTGVGKDGVASGIDQIMSALRPMLPMVDGILGPSAFASGQAVVRALDQQPCFMSLLGEFGITLQQLSNPKLNNAELMLKRVLLDLYNKSGFDRVLRPSVYSDKDKNTNMVIAPNLTILGESTPDSFFSGLKHQHIAEGLVPRFCLIEYDGPRPPRNKNAGFAPPDVLVEKVAELFRVSYQLQQNRSGIHIRMDMDAEEVLDDFDRDADEHINGAEDRAVAELWNRAHLKALKLAGLVAVGENFENPVIRGPVAAWAIDFVKRDIHTMEARFWEGDIGVGSLPQEAAVRRAIKDWMEMTPEQRFVYTKQKNLSELGQMIPYAYIRRRLRLLAPFQNGTHPPQVLIKQALQDMGDADILIEVPQSQMLQEFQSRAKTYALGPAF
jgi:hypothetical protein